MRDVSDKLRFLRTTYQDCDVLFFGSSRVVHQIEPKIFDETVAASGAEGAVVQTKVEFLWPPESLYVLREILNHSTPR